MSPRIPPLVLVLVAALLMWLIDRLLPLGVALAGLMVPAALLAVAGVVICALGVLSFRRAGTTVNPLEPERASQLVVTGIYRFTRNPMYLGFALLLLAWAMFLASPPALFVLAAFVAWMNRFQIAPEERALGLKFGEDFAAYRRAVRRWL